MRLGDFGLLTDESLDPRAVAFLREQGFDVVDTVEAGWRGHTDRQLLRHAVEQRRVVVTHDSDFGTLATHGGMPLIGIVFLRPGHDSAAVTIETLEFLIAADPEVTPPFVLVVTRKGDRVRMRVRDVEE